MQPKTVLALAIATLLLALVVLFVKPQAHDDASALDRRLFFGLRSEQVSRVTISGRGRSRLVLSKGTSQPARWILAGDEHRLSSSAVQSLLSALEFLQATRRLADKAVPSAKRLGLKPARLDIEVVSRSGTFRLQLGDGDVSGRGVYARARGAFWVVAASVRRALDVQAESLYERRIVLRSARDITSLSWRVETASRQQTTLARDEQGTLWVHCKAPVAFSLPADPARAQALLAWISGVRATRFLAGVPSAQSGHTRAALTIVVRFAGANESSRSFAMLGRCPGFPSERLLRVDEKIHVCVEKAAVLPKEPQELVSRRPFAVPLSELKQLSWSLGGTKKTLRRSGGVWRESDVRGPGSPLDSRALQRWFTALKAVTGKLVLSSDGEWKQAGRLRLQWGAGRSRELTFWRSAQLPEIVDVRIQGGTGSLRFSKAPLFALLEPGPKKQRGARSAAVTLDPSRVFRVVLSSASPGHADTKSRTKTESVICERASLTDTAWRCSRKTGAIGDAKAGAALDAALALLGSFSPVADAATSVSPKTAVVDFIVEMSLGSVDLVAKKRVASATYRLELVKKGCSGALSRDDAAKGRGWKTVGGGKLAPRFCHLISSLSESR
jgi:hypothetical protein